MFSELRQVARTFNTMAPQTHFFYVLFYVQSITSSSGPTMSVASVPSDPVANAVTQDRTLAGSQPHAVVCSVAQLRHLGTSQQLPCASVQLPRSSKFCNMSPRCRKLCIHALMFDHSDTLLSTMCTEGRYRCWGGYV